MSKQNNTSNTAGGFFIPVSLFLCATGLTDERNNQKDIMEFINKYHPSREGYLWYHDALTIAKDMKASGKFWMYYDNTAEHILNFFDDLVAIGKAEVNYK